MPLCRPFQTGKFLLSSCSVHFYAVLLSAALSASLFSGCAVGPDYLPPQIDMPEGWIASAGDEMQPPQDETPPRLERWWEMFSDPALNALIAHAVPESGEAPRNFDLRIAEARIRQARAQAKIAQASWFPAIGFSATAQRSHISPNSLLGQSAGQGGSGFAFLPGLTNNLFSMGFDALWELDFFGKTRRSVEAQDALYQASEEEMRQILLTLAGEIARNYVEYRANDERIDAIDRNIKSQQDSLSLTRSRFNAGMTSQLDVLQAEAQAASTESQRPLLQYSRDQAQNRLAVLLGEYPLFITKFFQAHPGTLPADIRFAPRALPAEILRKRPDIRASERQLAAATARIGVATAAFFPDFSLSLAGSLQSRESKNWLEWASRSWSIAPQVSLPVFQGGRLVGSLAAADAEQEAAFENYRRTVFSAVEEVENSISSYRQQRARSQSLSRAFDANRQSVEISQKLYTEGLADFLRVLESQRALLVTEDSVIATKAARITSLIALFKALGGGWAQPQPEFLPMVAKSQP